MAQRASLFGLTICDRLASSATSPRKVAVARRLKSACTSTTANFTGPSPMICNTKAPLNLMLDCISAAAAVISPSKCLTGAG